MLKYGFLLAAATAAIASPASAASYLFDIDYSGSGVASLAAGSDDPLSTVFASGDVFRYRLTATGAGQWTTLSSGDLFPFFALQGNFNSANVSFDLNLRSNGASVFSLASLTNNCCAHLGTNTVFVNSGLQYDQYDLIVTVNNIGAVNSVTSLLPFGGAPESNFAGRIAFDPNGDIAASVPEPGTWAMMILGFAFVGGAMRAAKRRQKVTLVYS